MVSISRFTTITDVVIIQVVVQLLVSYDVMIGSEADWLMGIAVIVVRQLLPYLNCFFCQVKSDFDETWFIYIWK